MLKSSSSLTLATLLLLAAPGAFAQETTGSKDPAAPLPAEEALPAAEPANDAGVKPVDGQIVMQDMNTLLASGLIGADVYSPADEWIGDVNDLIVDTKGALKGVVIGAGGIMGIGEKEVAFDISKLTFQPAEDRSTAKLILQVTPEELAATPSFKSAYNQYSEKRQEQQLPDPLAQPPKQ